MYERERKIQDRGQKDRHLDRSEGGRLQHYFSLPGENESVTPKRRGVEERQMEERMERFKCSQ